ncbi:hypothetical protein BY458DRAFT_501015 [Sporodiniella umbellata]|nr:hypothetical protein BY458DRAFT_501015 [Sporodiniella umbellata]
MHTLSLCHKCSKPLASTNSLQINICESCTGHKKRVRSRSFTFDIGQIADKVKQSLQLPPSIGRRSSMPSINDAYLEPPKGLNSSQANSRPNSRPCSRASSRASSFIEDVKQFLAPLSRKSSRTSLFQDFQREERELQKKSSHTSLLDALNPYKTKKSFSYERRVIYQGGDDQEEEGEIAMLNSQQIPILKTKEMKKIELREERMLIYENAYLESMQTQTGLMLWVTKQAQKGPPDDWFGYTPPPKEPKKFLGIFKRKAKVGDARQEQLRIGEDILNRLPSAYSPIYIPDDPPEEYEEQYDHEYTSSPSTVEASTPQQPVSILKKTHSSRDMYDYRDYEYEETFEDYPSLEEPRYPRREQRGAYQPKKDYFDYVEPSRQYSRRSRDSYCSSEYSTRRKRRDDAHCYPSYYTPKPYAPTTVEWELALDSLCDMFPRVDRFLIDEFLVSAQGDFGIAKDEIMNMMMERHHYRK